MVAQGKQAKLLTSRQERAVLDHLSRTRYPVRDRVMFLLSVKAGLRAKEIAALTWAMVTDAERELSDAIELPDAASKGRGGRTIPMHGDLKAALLALRETRGSEVEPHWAVVHSERSEVDGMSPGSVAVWFHRLYSTLGYDGCSSHSGRRTFITRAARKIVEAGGSLRDVQELAGHTSLATTQLYIQGTADAKRRVVAMI